jgi:hypothetical protein
MQKIANHLYEFNEDLYDSMYRALHCLELAERLEVEHRETGFHHIVIPDEETLKIIMATNVSKVSPSAVRMPYPSFGLSLPCSFKYHESCLLVGKPEFTDEDPVKSARGGIFPATVGRYLSSVERGKILPSFAICVMDEGTMESFMKSSKENLEEDRACLERISESRGITAPQSDEDETLDTMAEHRVLGKLVLQICVFIQAYPGVLKKGPGAQVIVTGNGKRRSRKRKRKPRNTQPSYIFTLPEELKKQQRVSWCPLHFRELRHPRYRRIDDEGNLLEVGEPGNTRIVEVKGHIRGGNVEHVDKDTKLAEALESR